MYPDDIELAREEGLKFEPLTKPLNILAEGNFAAGVQCVRMDFAAHTGTGDFHGKWELKPVPASEYVVAAQTVILASEFKTNAAPLALGTNLKINDNGSIWVDPETSQTSIPHLYAAGDAVASGFSMVDAMASAKKASQTIIQTVK